MNAELWSRTDENSQRITLLCWFKDRNIDISKYIDNVDSVSIEELRNLYIYFETHLWR